MSKKQTETDKPLIKGAHPTAPAGMGMPALAAELENVHGWKRHIVMAMTQKQRVAEVIQGRLDREAEFKAKPGKRDGSSDLDLPHCKHELLNCAECNGTAKAHDASLEDDLFEEVEVMFAHGVETILDPIDPDDLMAELLVTAKDFGREELDGGPALPSLLITDPHTYDYVFDNHAGAGPSGSSRWMSCTASLQASREFLETLTPNQQAEFAGGSEAGRQGTTAHAAAEVEARVILGELTSEEADLSLLELAVNPEQGEAYDDEMGEYITEYVDLVKSYVQEGREVHVEARVTAAVPLTGLHEGEVYEIPGSADFIALPLPQDEHSLVVGDLKYGNGIWVGVDENSQARIYALGSLALLADDEGNVEHVTDVVYHIIQPRMDGIKTWRESLADLLAWRDEVLAPALTAALYGQDNLPTEQSKFVPSEGACQFCPARGGCAALAEDRMENATNLFDVILESEYTDGPGTFPETSALSHDRLGDLLSQVEGLIDLHKDLKAEAERRLFRGEQVPGRVLVNYQPPRKWKEGAQDKIAQEETNLPSKRIDELFKPADLLTPTQAEKVLGEDYASIEAWVDKPDKRPVVAKEGDRRKVWESKPPESMFDIEGDE